MRGWKNIFYANGKQKKAGVAILVSDKIDLKIVKITKGRDENKEYGCESFVREKKKIFR